MSRPAAPLTVALPTCNGARHLGEALRSILAQQADEFDLLVCDDRSEDETLAVVRREAGDRARVVVNSERLGLAGNWNRCAEMAGTLWVAIFHQDDLMRPGHLAGHLGMIEREPGLGMICGAAGVIDDEGRPVPPSVVDRPDLGPADRVFEAGGFVAELARRNPVRCSAVSLRVAALDEIGGFDPAFRYAVDWDCWLRLARRFPVAWRASPSVAIRWHLASETHRFKWGTADLDEVAGLLDRVHTADAPLLPDPARSRSAADRFLARAYLARADEALCLGEPPLARRCLRRSLALRAGALGTIARSPRLAARMGLLLVAPGLVARGPGDPG